MGPERRGKKKKILNGISFLCGPLAVFTEIALYLLQAVIFHFMYPIAQC